MKLTRLEEIAEETHNERVPGRPGVVEFTMEMTPEDMRELYNDTKKIWSRAGLSIREIEVNPRNKAFMRVQTPWFTVNIRQSTKTGVLYEPKDNKKR